MSLELDLIQAINESPDDRTPQLIYADWLDDLGDPRGEAWRVLIEQGKRPAKDFAPLYSVPFMGWNWFPDYPTFPAHAVLPFYHHIDFEARNGHGVGFHAAMDAAAIAWVRRHRDPNFLKPETERV